MHQSLSFAEIPEHGIHIEVPDLLWFPSNVARKQGPVLTKLFLVKKGADKIEIEGKIQGILLLVCDLCLEKYPYTFDAPIQLIIGLNDSDQHWQVHDLEPGKTDFEIVLLDEPLIDIGDLLRQQLLLTLPEKQLCDSSCKGLCSRCGIDLNNKSCECDRDLKISPFAVLAQLKKNK